MLYPLQEIMVAEIDGDGSF